jgi:hypothetical protein
MRIARLSLFLGAITAALPMLLGAQTYSRAGIDVGSRARVTTPGVPGPDRYAGRVVAINPDSLTLDRDGASAPSVISFSAITKLEVSRGKHPNGWRGAWMGFLGGAAVGTVVGLVTHKPGRGRCSILACGPDYRPEKGIEPASGAMLGAIGGTLVGAIAGRMIKSERWETR